MSDQNTAPSGGGEALPAATSDLQQPQAPNNEAPTQPDPEQEKAEQERQQQEKQRNRTKEYINRINRENAEMRQRLQEMERSKAPPTLTQPQADDGPTLEQFDYDMTKFQQARDKWLADKVINEFQEKQTRAETERRQQETLAAYNERLASFAEQHPDFPEVVGSIAYPISDEVTRAILAHPQGPELAYHLGNNPDDAFLLASIAPHLADAAVQRIAARLGAAPAEPITAPAAPAKPISQAPQPPPKVAGRTVTDPPPEKMTDDEWFRAQQAKRRR